MVDEQKLYMCKQYVCSSLSLDTFETSNGYVSTDDDNRLVGHMAQVFRELVKTDRWIHPACWAFTVTATEKLAICMRHCILKPEDRKSVFEALHIALTICLQMMSSSASSDMTKSHAVEVLGLLVTGPSSMYSVEKTWLHPFIAELEDDSGYDVLAEAVCCKEVNGGSRTTLDVFRTALDKIDGRSVDLMTSREHGDMHSTCSESIQSLYVELGGNTVVLDHLLHRLIPTMRFVGFVYDKPDEPLLNLSQFPLYRLTFNGALLDEVGIDIQCLYDEYLKEVCSSPAVALTIEHMRVLELGFNFATNPPHCITVDEMKSFCSVFEQTVCWLLDIVYTYNACRHANQNDIVGFHQHTHELTLRNGDEKLISSDIEAHVQMQQYANTIHKMFTTLCAMARSEHLMIKMLNQRCLQATSMFLVKCLRTIMALIVPNPTPSDLNAVPFILPFAMLIRCVASSLRHFCSVDKALSDSLQPPASDICSGDTNCGANHLRMDDDVVECVSVLLEGMKYAYHFARLSDLLANSQTMELRSGSGENAEGNAPEGGYDSSNFDFGVSSLFEPIFTELPLNSKLSTLVALQTEAIIGELNVVTDHWQMPWYNRMRRGVRWTLMNDNMHYCRWLLDGVESQPTDSFLIQELSRKLFDFTIFIFRKAILQHEDQANVLRCYFNLSAFNESWKFHLPDKVVCCYLAHLTSTKSMEKIEAGVHLAWMQLIKTCKQLAVAVCPSNNYDFKTLHAHFFCYSYGLLPKRRQAYLLAEMMCSIRSILDQLTLERPDYWHRCVGRLLVVLDYQIRHFGLKPTINFFDIPWSRACIQDGQANEDWMLQTFAEDGTDFDEDTTVLNQEWHTESFEMAAKEMSKDSMARYKIGWDKNYGTDAGNQDKINTLWMLIKGCLPLDRDFQREVSGFMIECGCKLHLLISLLAKRYDKAQTFPKDQDYLFLATMLLRHYYIQYPLSELDITFREQVESDVSNMAIIAILKDCSRICDHPSNVTKVVKRISGYIADDGVTCEQMMQSHILFNQILHADFSTEQADMLAFWDFLPRYLAQLVEKYRATINNDLRNMMGECEVNVLHQLVKLKHITNQTRDDDFRVNYGDRLTLSELMNGLRLPFTMGVADIDVAVENIVNKMIEQQSPWKTMQAYLHVICRESSNCRDMMACKMNFIAAIKIYHQLGNDKSVDQLRKPIQDACSDVRISEGHLGVTSEAMNENLFKIVDESCLTILQLCEATQKQIKMFGDSFHEICKTNAKVLNAESVVSVLVGFMCRCVHDHKCLEKDVDDQQLKAIYIRFGKMIISALDNFPKNRACLFELTKLLITIATVPLLEAFGDSVLDTISSGMLPQGKRFDIYVADEKYGLTIGVKKEPKDLWDTVLACARLLINKLDNENNDRLRNSLCEDLLHFTTITKLPSVTTLRHTMELMMICGRYGTETRDLRIWRFAFSFHNRLNGGVSDSSNETFNEKLLLAFIWMRRFFNFEMNLIVEAKGFCKNGEWKLEKLKDMWYVEQVELDPAWTEILRHLTKKESIRECSATYDPVAAITQHQYCCYSCNISGMMKVCPVCAVRCHSDHNLIYKGMDSFRCKCELDHLFCCNALKSSSCGSVNDLTQIPMWYLTNFDTTDQVVSGTDRFIPSLPSHQRNAMISERNAWYSEHFWEFLERDLKLIPRLHYLLKCRRSCHAGNIMPTTMRLEDVKPVEIATKDKRKRPNRDDDMECVYELLVFEEAKRGVILRSALESKHIHEKAEISCYAFNFDSRKPELPREHHIKQGSSMRTHGRVVRMVTAAGCFQMTTAIVAVEFANLPKFDLIRVCMNGTFVACIHFSEPQYRIISKLTWIPETFFLVACTDVKIIIFDTSVHANTKRPIQIIHWDLMDIDNLVVIEPHQTWISSKWRTDGKLTCLLLIGKGKEVYYHEVNIDLILENSKSSDVVSGAISTTRRLYLEMNMALFSMFYCHELEALITIDRSDVLRLHTFRQAKCIDEISIKSLECSCKFECKESVLSGIPCRPGLYFSKHRKSSFGQYVLGFNGDTIQYYHEKKQVLLGILGGTQMEVPVEVLINEDSKLVILRTCTVKSSHVSGEKPWRSLNCLRESKVARVSPRYVITTFDNSGDRNVLSRNGFYPDIVDERVILKNIKITSVELREIYTRRELDLRLNNGNFIGHGRSFTLKITNNDADHVITVVFIGVGKMGCSRDPTFICVNQQRTVEVNTSFHYNIETHANEDCYVEVVLSADEQALPGKSVDLTIGTTNFQEVVLIETVKVYGLPTQYGNSIPTPIPKHHWHSGSSSMIIASCRSPSVEASVLCTILETIRCQLELNLITASSLYKAKITKILLEMLRQPTVVSVVEPVLSMIHHLTSVDPSLTAGRLLMLEDVDDFVFTRLLVELDIMVQHDHNLVLKETLKDIEIEVICLKITHRCLNIDSTCTLDELSLQKLALVAVSLTWNLVAMNGQVIGGFNLLDAWLAVVSSAGRCFGSHVIASLHRIASHQLDPTQHIMTGILSIPKSAVSCLLPSTSKESLKVVNSVFRRFGNARITELIRIIQWIVLDGIPVMWPIYVKAVVEAVIHATKICNRQIKRATTFVVPDCFAGVNRRIQEYESILKAGMMVHETLQFLNVLMSTLNSQEARDDQLENVLFAIRPEMLGVIICKAFVMFAMTLATDGTIFDSLDDGCRSSLIECNQADITRTTSFLFFAEKPLWMAVVSDALDASVQCLIETEILISKHKPAINVNNHGVYEQDTFLLAVSKVLANKSFCKVHASIKKLKKINHCNFFSTMYLDDSLYLVNRIKGLLLNIMPRADLLNLKYFSWNTEYREKIMIPVQKFESVQELSNCIKSIQDAPCMWAAFCAGNPDILQYLTLCATFGPPVLAADALKLMHLSFASDSAGQSDDAQSNRERNFELLTSTKFEKELQYCIIENLIITDSLTHRQLCKKLLASLLTCPCNKSETFADLVITLWIETLSQDILPNVHMMDAFALSLSSLDRIKVAEVLSKVFHVIGKVADKIQSHDLFDACRLAANANIGCLANFSKELCSRCENLSSGFQYMPLTSIVSSNAIDKKSRYLELVGIYEIESVKINIAHHHLRRRVKTIKIYYCAREPTVKEELIERDYGWILAAKFSIKWADTLVSVNLPYPVAAKCLRIVYDDVYTPFMSDQSCGICGKLHEFECPLSADGQLMRCQQCDKCLESDRWYNCTCDEQKSAEYQFHFNARVTTTCCPYLANLQEADDTKRRAAIRFAKLKQTDMDIAVLLQSMHPGLPVIGHDVIGTESKLQKLLENLKLRRESAEDLRSCRNALKMFGEQSCSHHDAYQKLDWYDEQKLRDCWSIKKDHSHARADCAGCIVYFLAESLQILAARSLDAAHDISLQQILSMGYRIWSALAIEGLRAAIMLLVLAKIKTSLDDVKTVLTDIHLMVKSHTTKMLDTYLVSFQMAVLGECIMDGVDVCFRYSEQFRYLIEDCLEISDSAVINAVLVPCLELLLSEHIMLRKLDRKKCYNAQDNGNSKRLSALTKFSKLKVSGKWIRSLLFSKISPYVRSVMSKIVYELALDDGVDWRCSSDLLDLAIANEKYAEEFFKAREFPDKIKLDDVSTDTFRQMLERMKKAMDVVNTSVVQRSCSNTSGISLAYISAWIAAAINMLLLGNSNESNTDYILTPDIICTLEDTRCDLCLTPETYHMPTIHRNFKDISTMLAGNIITSNIQCRLLLFRMGNLLPYQVQCASDITDSLMSIMLSGVHHFSKFNITFVSQDNLGVMKESTYSSADPRMGPRMIDVKRTICLECGCQGLLHPSAPMELVVKDRVIDLLMLVRDVYQRMWIPNNDTELPMQITFRIARENESEMISTLNETDDEMQLRLNIETKALALVEYDGVKNIAKWLRVSDLDECAGSLILKLCDVLDIMMESDKVVTMLVENTSAMVLLTTKLAQSILHMCESKRKTDFSMTGTLKCCHVLKRILIAVDSTMVIDVLDNDVIGDLRSSGLNQTTMNGFLEQMTENLLAQAKNDRVKNHPGETHREYFLALAFAELVSLMILGSRSMFDTMYTFTMLESEKYCVIPDDIRTLLSRKMFDVLCIFEIILRFVPLSKNGRFLRSLAVEYDIVDKCLRLVVQWTSEENSRLVGQESATMPLILKMLMHLSRGYKPTQEKVAEYLSEFLVLVRPLADARIAAAAEGCLKCLMDESDDLYDKIKAEREAITTKKRDNAMRRRRQEIQRLNVAAASGRYLTAESLTNEFHTCGVCKEGSAFKPDQLLYLMAFSRSVSSAVCVYQVDGCRTSSLTVSAFHCIHMGCYHDSVMQRLQDEQMRNTLNWGVNYNTFIPIWTEHISNEQLESGIAKYVGGLAKACGFNMDVMLERVDRCLCHDLKNIMLRFANHLTLCEDAEGGSRESNMCSVPYVFMLITFALQKKTVYLSNVVELMAFLTMQPAEWLIPSTYQRKYGPHYWTIMALCLMLPREWIRYRRHFLATILAAMAHYGSVDLRNMDAGDYALDTNSKLRSALIYFAVIDSFFEFLHRFQDDSADDDAVNTDVFTRLNYAFTPENLLWCRARADQRILKDCCVDVVSKLEALYKLTGEQLWKYSCHICSIQENINESDIRHFVKVMFQL